jgi:hypothetical protein
MDPEERQEPKLTHSPGDGRCLLSQKEPETVPSKSRSADVSETSGTFSFFKLVETA